MMISFFCSSLPLGQIALETVSSPHLFAVSSSGLPSKPTTHNQQTQAPHMQKTPKADARKQPPTYTQAQKQRTPLERENHDTSFTTISYLKNINIAHNQNRAKTKPKKKKFHQTLTETNQCPKHKNHQRFSTKSQGKKNHPKPKTWEGAERKNLSTKQIFL